MAGNAGQRARKRKADRMAPYRKQDWTLSIHRAFVVHLGAKGARQRRRFAGSVEHLSSGRSARFSSLEGLLAFFDQILEAGHTASPDPGDSFGIDVPSTIGRTLHPPPASTTLDVDDPARRQI
jgi:hypothetical protein